MTARGDTGIVAIVRAVDVPNRPVQRTAGGDVPPGPQKRRCLLGGVERGISQNSARPGTDGDLGRAGDDGSREGDGRFFQSHTPHPPVIADGGDGATVGGEVQRGMGRMCPDALKGVRRPGLCLYRVRSRP